MNTSSAVTREVQSLIETVCDGLADDAQVRDLESLLLTDEQACKFYVYLLDLDAKLQWLVRSRQEGNVALNEFIAAKQTPQQPTPTFPATLWHGTVGWFSSGWPMAYLVATVIFGVGLLIGSLVTVSRYTQPTHIALQPPPSNPSVTEPRIESVGRITGMVDCRCERSLQVPSPKSQDLRPKSIVSLGDKFLLSSGLMEITYDTGAKVILQGPVKYVVESAAGGFLSLGKVTARVEKKAEETLIPNPQSPIPHSPLSTLHSSLSRTPTATVTDLGTEFGVEVNHSGLTESHVFRGAVKVQLVGGDGKEGRSVIVNEHESVRVEKAGVDAGPANVVLHRVAANPERFVRNLPAAKKRLPLHVIAYFRLGEDDPDAAPGRPAGARTINHVGSRHLEKYGSIRYTADTAAPGSSLAMSFEEPGAHFTSSDLYLSVSDYFILEAWVRANRVKDVPTVIVYNGRGGEDGYGLMTVDRRWQFMFCGALFRRLGDSVRGGQVDPPGAGVPTGKVATLGKRPARRPGCERRSERPRRSHSRLAAYR